MSVLNITIDDGSVLQKDQRGLVINNLIDPSVSSTEGSWAFYPMYQKGQTGSQLVWQIFYNDSEKSLYTVHGQAITTKGEPGELTTSAPSEIELNQSGKNYQEQALMQARKKRLDKYRKGYRSPGETGDIRLPVQLANKFVFPSTSNPPAAGELTPARAKIKPSHLKIGVMCQPKIDGIRAIAWDNGTEIEMVSRNGIIWKYLDKIKNELGLLMSYLPSGVGIDGEMWRRDWKFEKLTSVVRTEKRKHSLNDSLFFYVFDIAIPETILEDRITMLQNAYKAFLEDGHKNTYFHI